MFTFFPELSAALVQNGLLLLLAGETALGAIVLFLLIRLHRQNAKLKVFFSGKEAKDLEAILLDQKREVETLDQEIQELFEISNRLRELGLKSLHKTSIIRFNPFKEVGGNQSFCITLLDGKNSGFVLSSLHTREGTRIYAKPVLAGNPDGFAFTEEEKKAITQAQSGKPAIV